LNSQSYPNGFPVDFPAIGTEQKGNQQYGNQAQKTPEDGFDAKDKLTIFKNAFIRICLVSVSANSAGMASSEGITSSTTGVSVLALNPGIELF